MDDFNEPWQMHPDSETPINESSDDDYAHPSDFEDEQFGPLVWE